jgi:hypothetical protein
LQRIDLSLNVGDLRSVGEHWAASNSSDATASPAQVVRSRSKRIKAADGARYGLLLLHVEVGAGSGMMISRSSSWLRTFFGTLILNWKFEESFRFATYVFRKLMDRMCPVLCTVCGSKI